jgi:hypothetical protein
MRGIIIIFIGLVTTPLIAGVIDATAPLFISQAGWSEFEVSITLLSLKFLWPILFAIMGIVSIVKKANDYSDSGGGPAMYTRKTSYKRYKGDE